MGIEKIVLQLVVSERRIPQGNTAVTLIHPTKSFPMAECIPADAKAYIYIETGGSTVADTLLQSSFTLTYLLRRGFACPDKNVIT